METANVKKPKAEIVIVQSGRFGIRSVEKRERDQERLIQRSPKFERMRVEKVSVRISVSFLPCAEAIKKTASKIAKMKIP